MSTSAEFQAAKVLGPRGMPLATQYATSDLAQRSLTVVAVTAATQVIDVTDPAAGVLPSGAGRLLKLNAEADCYYYWSDDSSATLDETKTGATNPEKQCDRLWSGQPTHEAPSGRYLVIKGVAACKLRMSIASP